VSEYLRFLSLGLPAGAVYAALAVGLISMYRATGVLNFAQGALVAWAPFVYVTLRTTGEYVLPVGEIHVGILSVVPALVVASLSATALAITAHYVVFRPLRHAPALAQVVASIGVMIVMEALAVLRFGSDALYTPPILPSSSATALGVSWPVNGLYLALMAVGLALATWAYFRFSRHGVATRAGAEDERGLRLMGYSPDRLAALALGFTVGAGSLIATLASPTVGLNSTVFTFAVIPALAVALLGRLTSIGTACISALALGAFQSLITLLSSKPWWPSWGVSGVEDALPFLVIVCALFIFGGRIPSRGSLGEIRLPPVTVPKLNPLLIGLTTAGAVLALVTASGEYRFAIVTSMILVLLAVSYVLLTGYLGQISLAQLALAGASGFMLSKLTTTWQVPFPFSVLAAALFASAIGLVVGVPALRIRGAQLAVVTLALAVAVEDFVFNNPSFTPYAGDPVGNPSLFGVNLAVRQGTDLTRLPFCFMVLAVVLIVVVLAGSLMRGDTGRAFLAVRSNERAAAAAGVDVRWCKLAGFVMSAFIAGVAGALIGYSRGQFSADSFSTLTGVTILAIVYLGGIGSLAGAVIAGLTGPLGVAYTFFNDTLNVGNYYTLLAGLGLIVTALFNPTGVAGKAREQRKWLVARFSRHVPQRPGAESLADSVSVTMDQEAAGVR
jgi:branched-chain amino acid transport system permease protein